MGAGISIAVLDGLATLKSVYDNFKGNDSNAELWTALTTIALSAVVIIALCAVFRKLREFGISSSWRFLIYLAIGLEVICAGCTVLVEEESLSEGMSILLLGIFGLYLLTYLVLGISFCRSQEKSIKAFGTGLILFMIMLVLGSVWLGWLDENGVKEYFNESDYGRNHYSVYKAKLDPKPYFYALSIIAAGYYFFFSGVKGLLTAVFQNTNPDATEAQVSNFKGFKQLETHFSKKTIIWIIAGVVATGALIGIWNWGRHYGQNEYTPNGGVSEQALTSRQNGYSDENIDEMEYGNTNWDTQETSEGLMNQSAKLETLLDLIPNIDALRNRISLNEMHVGKDYDAFIREYAFESDKCLKGEGEISHHDVTIRCILTENGELHGRYYNPNGITLDLNGYLRVNGDLYIQLGHDSEKSEWILTFVGNDGRGGCRYEGTWGKVHKPTSMTIRLER